MELVYIGKQLLLMFGVGLAGFLIGKGIFRSSLSLEPLEQAALLTPVGLGTIILLLFGLGLLGLLSLTPALGCIGLLIALSLWRFKPTFKLDRLRALASKITIRRFLALVAALILLAPAAMTPLTPPIYSDEIRYHLPYALHFVEQGAIVPDLYLRYPFFTLNINLLYALALMIGDVVTTHFMHFMLGLLAALNLYCLARRLSNAITAFASALLFLTLPTIAQLSASAYIDLGLACFTFAAITCLDHCRGNRRSALIVCAALLFGISLGSKYLALAYLPVMLVWAYFHSKSMRSTLLFLSISVIFGLPWYIYNAIHTGNPISPFAGEIFGYWPWREEDLARQFRDFDSRGFGYSPLALLKLPYNLVVHHWHFSSPPVPLILIAVFPCLFALRWMERRLRPFAILLLAAILFWFFTAQVFRYLAAFLPLWCFFSVWFIVQLIALAGRKIFSKNWVDRVSKLPFAVSPTLVLLLVLYHYSDNNRLVFPSEAKQLVSNREAFLRKRLPEYGLIDYLHNSEIKDKNIYQIQTGALLTYIRNNRILGDFRGILGYAYFYNKHGKDAEGFIEELADKDISFLAAKRDSAVFRWWEMYMRNNLAVEYEDEQSVLFVIPGKA